MKRFLKSTLGVTLLEIMLVLAIAAMIIVMSIRYYQSANASQNANQVLSTIQAIAVGADNYANAGNGYTSLDNNAPKAYLGTNALKTPYGEPTVAGSGATKYTVTWASAIGSQVCGMVKQAVSSNTKITNFTCTGYTYDASQ